MQKKKDNYKFLFDNLTDSILLCDADFTIKESNHAADVILGKGEKIVWQKCYQMLRSSDHPCLDCPLKDTLKSGVIIPLVYYDERFGEYFEERTHPIVDAKGKVKQFILTCKNVTKSRELEDKSAMMKKLSALGQISSGVAHDFNNVLTVVLGRVQLLKKQLSDPYILKSLDMIERAALDGAAKVRKIQEFSRPREGKLEEVIDLKKVIEEVVEITRPKWDTGAKIKGILIEPVLDLRNQVFINGDSSDLRNAFTNIIFNAIDAMPEGGVLSIKCYCDSSQAIAEFIDTGIGMTEEVLERIFDPFFSTKGVLGTGLGMSEVWGIVQRHNAHITINSHVGKGTTIRIFFPLAVKLTEAAETIATLEGAPCRILVVDDEDYILEILKELLSELGHSVITTNSAFAALKLSQQNHFDIMITDLGMPEMNGLEMAAKVKQIRADIQTILMSGWGLALDEKNLTNVDFLINKPFSIEKIIFTINEASSKIRQFQQTQNNH